jgi:protein-tyrosine-phosphatase
VFLLGEFGKKGKGKEIKDPAGGEIEDYRRCRKKIKNEVERVSKYLKNRYYD